MCIYFYIYWTYFFYFRRSASECNKSDIFCVRINDLERGNILGLKSYSSFVHDSITFLL